MPHSFKPQLSEVGNCLFIGEHKCCKWHGCSNDCKYARSGRTHGDDLPSCASEIDSDARNKSSSNRPEITFTTNCEYLGRGYCCNEHGCVSDCLCGLRNDGGSSASRSKTESVRLGSSSKSSRAVPSRSTRTTNPTGEASRSDETIHRTSPSDKSGRKCSRADTTIHGSTRASKSSMGPSKPDRSMSKSTQEPSKAESGGHGGSLADNSNSRSSRVGTNQGTSKAYYSGKKCSRADTATHRRH